VDDPQYDREALKIAEGKKDRRKQDALYVRVGRDGSVASTPHTISDEETRAEIDRAERYSRFVETALGGGPSSNRFDKATAALKLLFEDLG
jgi:hypothetical protein